MVELIRPIQADFDSFLAAESVGRRYNPTMTFFLRSLCLAGLLLGIASAVTGQAGSASPIRYHADLSDRDHHEMKVVVHFTDLPPGPLEVRMSRTSPGRYALHEFAKNVYNVSAVDGAGKELSISQPDLHQWNVTGHDGTVEFRYTLFGDHSDGTYAAIDASHAHLNVPASFVWARGLEDRPIEVKIEGPEDWRIASQLFQREDGTLSAPHLAYFIDSPIEVSAFEFFDWTIGEGEEQQTIELALHHEGELAEAQVIADLAQLVVDEQVATLGQAPRFDLGRYTFLVDALPWASGDAMEHRNSTIVSADDHIQQRSDRLTGAISHEFFHAWNVERIRPTSLEPFDLEHANVSQELWFSEGFTQYYGNLTLARIGVLSLEEFAERLSAAIDHVVRSPGTKLRSPIEMSTRAPFVDAATANEPTNRTNTFVSYYTYGAALALGLDLQLRAQFEATTLDDLMVAVWREFGRSETSFENDDLRLALGEVTGSTSFADDFFQRSVYGHTPPDFESLLAAVGLHLQVKSPGEAWLGLTSVSFQEANPENKESRAGLRVIDAPQKGTPAHQAGVGRGDLLLKLNDQDLTGDDALKTILDQQEAGATLTLEFEKRGETRTAEVTLIEDPTLDVVSFEAADMPVSSEVMVRRNAWLAARATPSVELLKYCPTTGEPYPFHFHHCPLHGKELQLTPRTRENS